jgi:hypothetical protein
MMRAKMLQQESQVLLYAGMVAWPVVPGWDWTGTGMKFGGHTNRGTTSDQNVINSGMAKNKIDIQYPQSKNNTYESRAFTATENELWKIN